MTLLTISQAELHQRQQALRAKLEKQGIPAAVLFWPVRIQYLTNFSHLSTERPIALIVPVEGEISMLIPKLEEQHLQVQVPWLKNVRVYDEFPGDKHPMLQLAKWMKESGIKTIPLGADHNGYLEQNSYYGPTLSDVFGTEIQPVSRLVDELRMVKSEKEINILRLSGEWAARTHQFLQNAMKEGKSERDISRIAEDHAVAQLDQEYGSAGHWGMIGVHASFRSGIRTAISHAAMGNRSLCQGDNLVTYCQGNVSGYITELERTMFLGEPSQKQKRLFEIVLEAQEIALEQIKPGNTCAQVDRLVRDFLESKGFSHAVQHHQGHGLGLEFHEGPFLDIGDPTIMETGMVFSVEPGLYFPEIGGFRHSDTVVVTDNGVDIITPYPRNLDDLIINPSN